MSPVPPPTDPSSTAKRRRGVRLVFRVAAAQGVTQGVAQGVTQGVALGVALGIALAAGCRPSRPAEFRVGLIGHFGPMDGPTSGEPSRRGAQLAVDELNAAGGVVIAGKPHRVVLVVKASPYRAGGAASVARELVNLDSADVIVGPQFSNLAAAAGEVAEESEVPMIAPMASAPDVTRGRAFVNRLAFVDAVQGRVLARFAHDSLGIRRVAALYKSALAYNRDVVQRFSDEFRAVGGEMIATEGFDADDPASRSRAVQRVLAARPDAVLVPTLYGADTLGLRQLRAGGFTGRVLGGDAWDAFFASRIAAANGAVFTTSWNRRSEQPGALSFRGAYTARHADQPLRATAAATYDAVRLLARAAERAGARSGRPVADALRESGRYDGAFGRLRFSGSGDPDREAIILEIEGDSARVRAIVPPKAVP